MRENHAIGVLLVLLLILTSGCDRSDTASTDAGDGVDRGMFGDPYQVVGNFNEADPELYPLLQGDTLLVRVTYSGGCETHELELDHEIERDTAFVWLRHDARNDDCEAHVQDEVRAVLPDRVLEQQVIALRHPQGAPAQVISRSPRTSP